MAVHLGGTFRTTRAATPHFRAQQYGRVINVTSYSGLHGNVGQANYAAAKAGIIGFTKTAAKELAGFGVTVNAISPNAETRMIASIPDAKKARACGRHPDGPLRRPRGDGGCRLLPRLRGGRLHHRHRAARRRRDVDVTNAQALCPCTLWKTKDTDAGDPTGRPAPAPGAELGTSDWFTIHQDRIDSFAEIDRGPAVDPHRPRPAADGPFGTTIAHGYLTLSLVSRFLLELARGHGRGSRRLTTAWTGSASRARSVRRRDPRIRRAGRRPTSRGWWRADHHPGHRGDGRRHQAGRCC